MECLDSFEELSKEARVERFATFLAQVAGVDDLFPPDSGVREPANKPRDLGPKAGVMALQLVWDNPKPPDSRPLYLVR